jgi:hypothetical protein
VEWWEVQTGKSKGTLMTTKLGETLGYPAFSPDLQRLACMQNGASVILDLTGLKPESPPQVAVLQLLTPPSQAGGSRHELTMGAGEIRLEGRFCRSYLPASEGFNMDVTSFTLPNGRTRKLPRPKNKNVDVTAGTLLHEQGNPAQKVALTDLKEGVFISVIGEDRGSEVYPFAREVVVWRTR